MMTCCTGADSTHYASLRRQAATPLRGINAIKSCSLIAAARIFYFKNGKPLKKRPGNC